ncbi:hypothetical protein JW710_04335 [Candidatus Dojkabacteria bacterium]|nr:hypothetical protein [Candidatus Dojkabacteria bacterium]
MSHDSIGAPGVEAFIGQHSFTNDELDGWFHASGARFIAKVASLESEPQVLLFEVMEDPLECEDRLWVTALCPFGAFRFGHLQAAEMGRVELLQLCQDMDQGKFVVGLNDFMESGEEIGVINIPNMTGTNSTNVLVRHFIEETAQDVSRMVGRDDIPFFDWSESGTSSI